MTVVELISWSSWWNLSCDDDVWLHEQATMNRAQNLFVDEQLPELTVNPATTTLVVFRGPQDPATATSVDVRLDRQKQDLHHGSPQRACPGSNSSTHACHHTWWQPSLTMTASVTRLSKRCATSKETKATSKKPQRPHQRTRLELGNRSKFLVQSTWALAEPRKDMHLHYESTRHVAESAVESAIA